MANCESSPYRTAQLLDGQPDSLADHEGSRGVDICRSQVGFGSQWSPLPLRLWRPQILRIELLTREIFGPICSSHLASLLDHLNRISPLILVVSQNSHNNEGRLTVLTN